MRRILVLLATMAGWRLAGDGVPFVGSRYARRLLVLSAMLTAAMYDIRPFSGKTNPANFASTQFYEVQSIAFNTKITHLGAVLGGALCPSLSHEF
jgi:hypothetical protein